VQARHDRHRQLAHRVASTVHAANEFARGIESIDLLRAVEEDARDPAIAYELNHAFIL
jgi:hypothetical protein